jgi:hypothetical protein
MLSADLSSSFSDSSAMLGTGFKISSYELIWLDFVLLP